MSNLAPLRASLEQRKGQRAQLQLSLGEARQRVRGLQRDARNLDEAQAILQRVAQQTQAELEWRVSELVTLALAAVFEEDPYEFRVNFVQRRGKTEADLVFIRAGTEVSPLAAAGGGAVDVASFALRVALWRLQVPRPRATIVLDEPLKFLSRDLQPRVAKFLGLLSAQLGLQIIMVTHSPDLIEEADRVFRVRIRGDGVSEVTV